MFEVFKRKGDKHVPTILGIIIAGFVILFLGTQLKTCVTCDGVVMKTVWDTYVCVEESVLKD